MILVCAFNKSIKEELEARLASPPAEPLQGSDLQEDYFQALRALGPDENLVLEAGAGTGKTTTILEGIRRLRKPAEALTLHSAGYRLLQEHLGKVRLDNKAQWSLLEELAQKHAGGTPRELGFWLTCRSTVALAEKVMSWVKGTNPLFENGTSFRETTEDLAVGVDLPEGYEVEALELVARIAFEATMSQVKAARARQLRWISFDDMIFLPVRLGLRPSGKR